MPIIGSTGGTTAVFRFKMYSVIKDEFVLSKRYATMRTIEQIRAVQTGPSHEIPSEDLDENGMTDIDYVLPAER